MKEKYKDKTYVLKDSREIFHYSNEEYPTSSAGGEKERNLKEKIKAKTNGLLPKAVNRDKSTENKEEDLAAQAKEVTKEAVKETAKETMENIADKNSTEEIKEEAKETAAETVKKETEDRPKAKNAAAASLIGKKFYDAFEKARIVKEKAKENAEEAAQKVKQAGEGASEKLKNQTEEAKEQVQEKVEDTKEQVEEHGIPFQSETNRDNTDGPPNSVIKSKKDLQGCKDIKGVRYIKGINELKRYENRKRSSQVKGISKRKGTKDIKTLT
ncbi:hypothetical protein [Salibacterium aidingense]|uniref:hypothetical protein n=1 Tax=Salibacterium aidingense TaxID=384933 RepID=UPI000422DABF|nr:hypothetical protein [Salibacterium aidingense]